MLGLTSISDLVQREHPQNIKLEWEWGHEHNNLHYLRNGATVQLQGKTKVYHGLIESRIGLRAFDLYQNQ